MAITGEIKTLYKDREQNQAVFPVTKTKAVTTENNVSLDAILGTVVHAGQTAETITTTPLNADSLGGRPAADYATENFVKTEIAQAQLGGSGGDIDLSGFATKDELSALDYEDVGAAPAGYGWGEGSPSSKFTANNVNRTAVFVSVGDDMPTNDSVWLCEFYATSDDGSGNWGHMVATCQGGVAKGCICVRLKENGVFQPWEFQNPPMVPGVEYRTTERIDGKVVYKKNVDGVIQYHLEGQTEWKSYADLTGAVNKNGDTMTNSLKINGSWKGILFGDNAAILNAGTRLTIDQRPQNSTGSYERYTLPTPMERTADAWYNIVTTKAARVLWTNASPTSSFTSQVINVTDLGRCSCIAIVFNQSGANEFTTIHHKDVASTLDTTVSGVRYEGTPYVVERHVKVDFANSQVYFGTGSQQGGQSHDRAIPVAVIGLY